MTTSSPAGSTAFFTLALLAICALVLLLLRYYLPLRTTPAYVTVPVFLAIALPASIVLLVPIDLASSNSADTEGSRGIWLSEKVVYKSWRVTYWLTFALTWFILPLLGEYCDSGYREPKARTLYSLRSNGRYYALVLGCSIVGMVYIFLWNGVRLESFKSVVMALAYAWGLVLAMYLMGHGLVAFPRSLYRQASISGRLKRIQSRAPKVHDRLTEALENLDQYEYQVLQLKQRKNGTAREFQEWIDILVEKSSLPENRAGVVGSMNGGSSSVPAVITERYLADLTRKLKRARHAKMRFENEWDRTVREAMKTQAILDSKASQRLEFKNSPFTAPGPGFFSRFTLLTPYTRFHLYVHVIPALLYLLWVTTILASVIIVWSECTKGMDPKLSIVGLSVVRSISSSRFHIGFSGQVIASCWLCYMCICAFFALTEVKIWGNRALVRRNTYQESATWYGLQVAKLTVPLAYNFATLTPGPIFKDTSFYAFLGQLIDFTPLGRGFSAHFPIFILVPVLATGFGLYGRIKNICGFGDLLEDEADEDAVAAQHAGTGSWREGRALIEREIQGANGNVLGLSQRSTTAPSTTSPPNDRARDRERDRYTDNPSGPSSSSRPPIGPSNTTLNPSSVSTSRPTRDRQRRRSPHTIDEGEAESENFFEAFGTRVRNTFETADFSFSRPRWLGGDDDGDDEGGRGRGRGGGGGADRTQGFMSLFGGRPDEGRVRI